MPREASECSPVGLDDPGGMLKDCIFRGSLCSSGTTGSFVSSAAVASRLWGLGEGLGDHGVVQPLDADTYIRIPGGEGQCWAQKEDVKALLIWGSRLKSKLERG